jgi:uncharacterized protein (DUF697 family)
LAGIVVTVLFVMKLNTTFKLSIQPSEPDSVTAGIPLVNLFSQLRGFRFFAQHKCGFGNAISVAWADGRN